MFQDYFYLTEFETGIIMTEKVTFLKSVKNPDETFLKFVINMQKTFAKFGKRVYNTLIIRCLEWRVDNDICRGCLK